MNRRIHISIFLIVTLLIGQLASVWHAVGHLEFQSHQAHTHEHGPQPIHHAENARFLVTTSGSNEPESDGELCLIYHTFGANEAYLPLMPHMKACSASSDNWSPTLIALYATYTPHTHIRGPPARS